MPKDGTGGRLGKRIGTSQSSTSNLLTGRSKRRGRRPNSTASPDGAAPACGAGHLQRVVHFEAAVLNPTYRVFRWVHSAEGCTRCLLAFCISMHMVEQAVGPGWTQAWAPSLRSATPEQIAQAATKLDAKQLFSCLADALAMVADAHRRALPCRKCWGLRACYRRLSTGRWSPLSARSTQPVRSASCSTAANSVRSWSADTAESQIRDDVAVGASILSIGGRVVETYEQFAAIYHAPRPARQLLEVVFVRHRYFAKQAEDSLPAVLEPEVNAYRRIYHQAQYNWIMHETKRRRSGFVAGLPQEEEGKSVENELSGSAARRRTAFSTYENSNNGSNDDSGERLSDNRHSVDAEVCPGLRSNQYRCPRQPASDCWTDAEQVGGGRRTGGGQAAPGTERLRDRFGTLAPQQQHYELSRVALFGVSVVEGLLCSFNSSPRPLHVGLGRR